MAGAEVQRFCLTWKDFNSVFNREFNELRESGDFFDVTLACEDGQVPAHKLVLSAASGFFKEILRRCGAHEHPLVYLSGVRAAEVGSILDFIYTGETEVAEDRLEALLAAGGSLRIKGLTESPEQQPGRPGDGGAGLGSDCWSLGDGAGVKVEAAEGEEGSYPLVAEDFDTADYDPSTIQVDPPARCLLSPRPPAWVPGPRPPRLGHQRALVQGNNRHETELNRRVAELMVSSYDPVLGKTIWQCAQCHYSSKLRYTVKEHVETHISGFCHQCPLCAKTCKTRNALRVHTIRKHNQKGTAGHSVVEVTPPGEEIDRRKPGDLPVVPITPLSRTLLPLGGLLGGLPLLGLGPPGHMRANQA